MALLDNKKIILTGGSGLIGKAILNDLRLKGANVYNLDINVDENDSQSIYCDITEKESFDHALGKVVSLCGGQLDGLVNNAYPRTKDWGNDFESINYESWEKNVSMQMNMTFYAIQKTLKFMKSQRLGSIVNITSIYGVVGNDFTIYEGLNMNPPAAYTAIKGGIVNFTRYLASYYGKYNIRVNCVSPGGIFDNQDPQFVKNYENKVPMKRMGKPEDIAPSISFLLSDESSYMTGQNIIIDGGWTAI